MLSSEAIKRIRTPWTAIHTDGVKALHLFGSTGRDEARTNSDIEKTAIRAL